MTVLGYSTQRVWLHWLSAAVIVWTLVSGFYVACVEVPAWISQQVAFINVSLTTVFMPFFVWRLFNFVAHARYTSVSVLSFMERLALFAHALIYLTVTVVLVTGVLMMDRPIDVFGLVDIAQPLSNPALIALFVTIHVWSCLVLSLLIVMHVGAVIVHELCGHRVLRRMSFCSIVRSERLE
ncbi:cytochrome b/b6 domain-containing protein [Pseudomonas sp. TH41]|uniref:cytochrome b n=1 Tax=Pseudomonas sp. TH41 TaxID=2796405 RepID=UPI0019129F85|nr:cytochrome b/b6 domain-containing protein [Pseudomonas sp. TH41]MBK5352962.1 cytochrome b/b6 domain-containing protein [Pseudomonas sp. TH41]